MWLYLIPAIWSLLLLLVIAKFPFYRMTKIRQPFVYSAFLFKLLLGFTNYYIWLNIIGHGDSLRYYHDSLIVYNSLFQNPTHYFELLTQTSIADVPKHLIPYQSELFIEWHVKEYNMVRLMAIINLFTFGNVWANIVLLGFAGFSASMALFKSLNKQFNLSGNNSKVLFGFLFFLPSLIFWTGGLLKEAPVFILMIVIALQLFKIAEKTNEYRTSRLNYFYIIASLLLLFWIRDYVALITLVNLIIYAIVVYFKPFKFKPFKNYLGISIVLVVILFILPIAFPQCNYFKYAQDEQAYFLVGDADPDYQFRVIGDSGAELFKLIPYALNNVILRPNLINSHSLFRVYQSIEVMTIWILIGFLLYNIIKQKIKLPAIPILFIFISIELLFIYGLMVTDADTLSRYRSIPLFLVLLFLFVCRANSGQSSSSQEV